MKGEKRKVEVEPKRGPGRPRKAAQGAEDIVEGTLPEVEAAIEALVKPAVLEDVAHEGEALEAVEDAPKDPREGEPVEKASQGPLERESVVVQAAARPLPVQSQEALSAALSALQQRPLSSPLVRKLAAFRKGSEGAEFGHRGAKFGRLGGRPRKA